MAIFVFRIGIEIVEYFYQSKTHTHTHRAKKRKTFYNIDCWAKCRNMFRSKMMIFVFSNSNVIQLEYSIIGKCNGYEITLTYTIVALCTLYIATNKMWNTSEWEPERKRVRARESKRESESKRERDRGGR